ncbi:Trimeric GatFAB AmidoTransferase(AdT) complex subunit [Allomyces arbusculus]|nr:Trimeric GatFAB AmidoTransferase(AdT) complex subunit [Allomyces arbusculus]
MSVARSILATRTALHAGRLTPHAVIDSALTAISQHNPTCNALVHVASESHLLSQAAEATERYRSGTPRALEGIPVAIKDNFVTSDMPTTCASAVLGGYCSPFDATAVRLLREAGAIVVGKANMDEFGMGSFNTNSAHGAVVQPGGEGRVAGGSSGGSAVAVKTGMALAAIGSDTGGSVRLPAAYCGVVGLKPSYGSISRFGLVPYANSLDTVGVLANNVADAALLHDILSHPDPNDMTCLPAPPTTKRNPRRPLTIGVPAEYNQAQLDPAVRETWSRALTAFEAAGADVVPVHLPSTVPALAAYYVLAPAEAASNLAKYDGVRYGKARDAFGDEVVRRVLVGTFALSAGAHESYYVHAQRLRRQVVDEFQAAFTDVDAMVCPAALTAQAPTLDEIKHPKSGDSAYVTDVFTVPASLAGLPAVVVPAWDGVGLQVLGKWGDAAMVLDVAERLERMVVMGDDGAVDGEGWAEF